MNDTENNDSPRIGRSLEEATFPLRADCPGTHTPADAGNRATRRSQARTARKASSARKPARQPSPRKASRRSTAATSEPAATPPTSAPQPGSWSIPAGARSAELLKDMLAAFVPLHIMEMRSVPYAALQQMAAEAAEIIASHGDDLMFGGKHCPATYTALSNGLAAAALLAPGGIDDFMGLHFCAHPHPQCPSPPLTTRAAGEEERPSRAVNADGDRA